MPAGRAVDGAASVLAVQERLARVVCAREIAAEPDIFAVAPVNAADDGDLVVAGAMEEGEVAERVGRLRRPLDDSAGVVAGQPGANGVRMRGERNGNNGGGERPTHRNRLLFWPEGGGHSPTSTCAIQACSEPPFAHARCRPCPRIGHDAARTAANAAITAPPTKSAG